MDTLIIFYCLLHKEHTCGVTSW